LRSLWVRKSDWESMRLYMLTGFEC
jgi:hypothetical protein